MPVVRTAPRKRCRAPWTKPQEPRRHRKSRPPSPRRAKRPPCRRRRPRRTTPRTRGAGHRASAPPGARERPRSRVLGQAPIKDESTEMTMDPEELAARTLEGTKERLSSLEERPTAEHVEVFEQLHQELSAVLGALDPGANGVRCALLFLMTMAQRRLLDAELVRRGHARSRGHAAEIIDDGFVRVAGMVASKAATQVGIDQPIV